MSGFQTLCSITKGHKLLYNLIDRRDAGDRQRRKMTAPGDSNSLMVQNLRPGTRYKFRVAAENRHGISPESQAVTTRMLDEGIPKQPLWKNTVFILQF